MSRQGRWSLKSRPSSTWIPSLQPSGGKDLIVSPRLGSGQGTYRWSPECYSSLSNFDQTLHVVSNMTSKLVKGHGSCSNPALDGLKWRQPNCAKSIQITIHWQLRYKQTEDYKKRPAAALLLMDSMAVPCSLTWGVLRTMRCARKRQEILRVLVCFDLGDPVGKPQFRPTTSSQQSSTHRQVVEYALQRRGRLFVDIDNTISDAWKRIRRVGIQVILGWLKGLKNHPTDPLPENSWFWWPQIRVEAPEELILTRWEVHEPRTNTSSSTGDHTAVARAQLWCQSAFTWGRSELCLLDEYPLSWW